MTITARPSDIVAAALWRAGITTIARSRKLHRPLGWSGACTTGTLARVDGRPNVRLDQITVRHGLRVEAHNVWPSARFDLLRLVQSLHNCRATSSVNACSAFADRSRRRLVEGTGVAGGQNDQALCALCYRHLDCRVARYGAIGKIEIAVPHRDEGHRNSCAGDGGLRGRAFRQKRPFDVSEYQSSRYVDMYGDRRVFRVEVGQVLIDELTQPVRPHRKNRGGTWTRSWFSMSTERRRADASAPDRVQPPDSFNRGVAGVVGPVQCANARTDNHIRSRHLPRSNAPATAPPRCGPSCWGGSGRNSRPLPQPSMSGLRTSSVGSSPPSRP